ncbi:hypothetical protein BAE44_0020823 [Dichanthelium oligosanthes]|uniref:RNase H type-1 domain-containing protein n=1 Tax=Dichanthelium oligosanthes TaxID=888268 RepID=A0A1E5UZ63_9POAL|nr:hypothetical protein BAE44_0020823 [Dichanthelium oligosanthes]
MELRGVRQQHNGFDAKGKNPACDSLVTGKHKAKEQEHSRWEPPKEGCMKINVDGAFDISSGEGGIGVTVRDATGTVQLTAWRYVRSGRDAEEVEAMACKEGLLLTAQWCQQNAILETDCSSMVCMLAKREDLRSHLKFIIDACQEAGDRLQEWKVVHTRRESNGVAHELAQLAKRTKHSAVWFFAAQMCVEQLIARECTLISD